MFSAPKPFEQLSNSHLKYFNNFFFPSTFLAESGNSSFEENIWGHLGIFWEHLIYPDVNKRNKNLMKRGGGQDRQDLKWILLKVCGSPMKLKTCSLCCPNQRHLKLLEPCLTKKKQRFLHFKSLYLNICSDCEASCKLKSHTVPVGHLSGDGDTSHTPSQRDTGILNLCR